MEYINHFELISIWNRFLIYAFMIYNHIFMILFTKDFTALILGIPSILDNHYFMISFMENFTALILGTLG